MSSKKKITFLVSSLSGGGAENVCVNIANKFAENNWEVDLVVLNLLNETYYSRLSDKINLVNLNVNHVRYSIIPLLISNSEMGFRPSGFELMERFALISIIVKPLYKSKTNG